MNLICTCRSSAERHSCHPARAASTRFLLAWLVLFGFTAAGVAAWPRPAAAQQLPMRAFPADTLAGRMQVGVFPLVVINGNSLQLSPGAVIRNDKNLFVTPASLSGGTYKVGFLLDPQSNVSNVWLLTDDEFAALRSARATARANGSSQNVAPSLPAPVQR